MFMSDAAWQADPKNKNKDKIEIFTKKALSLDYKKQAFRLAITGSDGVVNAYNELMQTLFQSADSPYDEKKMKHMMGLIGHLLLEIRRSTGNESTKLDRWGMLEWFITDVRNYRT